MIHIGIDPDVDKSGVALWSSEEKKFTAIVTVDFWDTILLLKSTQNIHVHIEAAWLIPKSNWHGGAGATAHRIAKNVGANHQIGKLIAQYCDRNHILMTLHKPTAHKTTAETFKKLTGETQRTNQEMRDAAMLVWNR